MARTIFESVFTNPGKPFRFVGRYSFLDFINTEVNEAGRRVNLLTDARDVVNWLVLAKMFERAKLKSASEKWQAGKTGVCIWKDALGSVRYCVEWPRRLSRAGRFRALVLMRSIS